MIWKCFRTFFTFGYQVSVLLPLIFNPVSLRRKYYRDVVCDPEEEGKELTVNRAYIAVTLIEKVPPLRKRRLKTTQ